MKKLRIPTLADFEVRAPEPTIWENIFNGRFEELEKLGIPDDEIESIALNYLKILKERKGDREGGFY